jgi:type VI secretion system protein ImpM
MPEPLIALPLGALLRGAAVGFCGKLPARGDFVAAGLPRQFIEPWHDWMQRGLAASRERLGEDWAAAWNEAPIWRFALAPGVCGEAPVLGLWMPSVDRIGRHFPLTFAAVAGDADADITALIGEGGGFLDAAEAAGLDALVSDTEPDVIAARLAAAAWGAPEDAGAPPDLRRRTGAVWWTDGAPRVPAGTLATGALPDAFEFVGMVQAGGAGAPDDFWGPQP